MLIGCFLAAAATASLRGAYLVRGRAAELTPRQFATSSQNLGSTSLSRIAPNQTACVENHVIKMRKSVLYLVVVFLAAMLPVSCQPADKPHAWMPQGRFGKRILQESDESAAIRPGLFGKYETYTVSEKKHLIFVINYWAAVVRISYSFTIKFPRKFCTHPLVMKSFHLTLSLLLRYLVKLEK